MSLRRLSRSPEVLAVVPARGGSKRLPGKNLKRVGGKSLVARAVEVARKSRCVDRVMVSTDDARIARAACRAGAEVPGLRPKHLAQDRTPTLAVIEHLLRRLRRQEGRLPGIVVLLQPTSPLRSARDVDAAVAKLVQTNADCVVSVCAAKERPELVRLLGRGGRLRSVGAGSELRSNGRSARWILNGAVYAFWTRTVLEQRSLYGRDVRGVTMERWRSIDIDNAEDLAQAEALWLGRSRR